MRRAQVLIAALLEATLFWGIEGLTFGAIRLDNYTIDKVMGAFHDHSFLLKIDSMHAYGQKVKEFEMVTKIAKDVPNFLVAEVAVHEYAAKENDDVRQRFGVEIKTWPTLFFLSAERGDRELSDAAERYTADFTAEAITAYLRKKGVQISSPGSIPELDEKLKEFLNDGHSDARLSDAKQLVDQQFSFDKKAAMYLKFMEKIKDKGAGYVAKEVERLTNLLAGTVKPEKRQDFEDKKALLEHFLNLQQEQQRDEL